MLETYLKLIWAYLKIGLFGFGGGYAMLSLIQREVVDSGWITSQMFTDIVAISQMTPGPIGINSATYIGYVVTGSVLGSLVTTLTVVLPPFILTLIASHYIQRHKQSPFIKGAFMGLHRLGSPAADEQREFRLPDERAHHHHRHLRGLVLHRLFHPRPPHPGHHPRRHHRPARLLIPSSPAEWKKDH